MTPDQARNHLGLPHPLEGTTMTTPTRYRIRPGLVIAAFAAGILLLIIGLVGCSIDQTPIDAAPATPSTSAPATAEASSSAEPDPTPTKAAPTKAAPTTKAPEPTKAAKPKPTAKPLTRSQENAIETAASYLDGSAFSKKGLIEQLEFEGYPKADAKFAVTWLERRKMVNWNDEAAESAESYLDGSSFSRKGLIEQLEFEGYTRDQAVHGVNKAGL